MSFKFSLTDITGQFPTVGIIFHGQQTPTLGISGYFINIVTEPNFIQIWYFENAYRSAGPEVLLYLGGWVFPGEVENTEFRAIIEGNMAYIYTEADYLAYGKGAYGCSADLTNGGQLTPYTYGGYGILNWSGANVQGKLTISNLSGKVAPKTDVTSMIVNGIISKENNVINNDAGIIYKDNNTFDVSGCAYNLYNGVTASDFEIKVTTNASGNVDIAGIMFRATKNSTSDGIDGYVLNFVSNGGNQFIQVYYLYNCYNTDGSASICQYIGGWVYPGQILGTEFTVKVIGSYLFVETANHHLEVPVCLQVDNLTEIKTGGFGVVSWAFNQADLTIHSIEMYK